MKKKAEITFEVEETTYLRGGTKVITAFCPFCRRTVEMITPRALADFTEFTEREIFRLIEIGKIHFVEAAGVYVCRNSLPPRPGENSPLDE